MRRTAMEVLRFLFDEHPVWTLVYLVFLTAPLYALAARGKR